MACVFIYIHNRTVYRLTIARENPKGSVGAVRLHGGAGSMLHEFPVEGGRCARHARSVDNEKIPLLPPVVFWSSTLPPTGAWNRASVRREPHTVSRIVTFV